MGVIAPVLRSMRLGQSQIRGWPQGMEQFDDCGIPVYLQHGWAWLGRRGYGRLWLKSGEQLFNRYVADFGMPDLVHAHTARYAGILAQRLGAPYVLTEHSSEYARGILPARDVGDVANAFAHAQARIMVSPQLGQLISEQFGTAINPWRWIPNIVDSEFKPGEENKNTEVFTFLNVGMLNENKGQSDLLRAFAAQFVDHPHVQLHIGGDGPLRASLERLADQVNIREQVRFLGLLTAEQVVAEMQSCDALALSSYVETFGVVLIEAMACGKPVVATACGGPEAIVNTDNGILVKPGDIAALGRALQEMFLQHDRYDPAQIRADCLAQYGEKAVVNKLRTVYHECDRSKV